MPELAIIIPAYNVERYIRRCLSSIIEAGGRDCEVIVVDDGSTDATAAIVREYEGELPNLFVHRQRNAGQSAARNAGLRLARSSHVMFVDADDWLRPDCLTTILAHLDGDSDITFTGRIRVSDRDGTEFEPVEFDSNVAVPITRIPLCRTLLAVHGKIFRKSFLSDYGIEFPEEMVWEDIVHSYACYLLAGKVSSIPIISYMWRVRDDELNPSTMQSLLQPSNIMSRFRQIAATLTIANYDEWKARWPDEWPYFIEFGTNHRFQLHVDALAACEDDAVAVPAMELMGELFEPYWEGAKSWFSGATLARCEAVYRRDLAALRALRGPAE